VYSYQIPAERILNSSFAKAALGGWTLQGIMSWRSGIPVNITSGRDLAGNGRVTGQRPDAVAGVDPYVRDDNSLVWLTARAFDNVTPAAQKRFGNLGFNTLFGPGGFSYDAAIHKTFPIHERHRITFRFEMFNALNHKILGTPNTTLTSPTFGQILSASGGRNIQLALKYQF